LKLPRQLFRGFSLFKGACSDKDFFGNRGKIRLARPMRITSRRKAIAVFVVLGIGLVALAVALQVGWIILNWRQGVLLFFGIIFFALIIAGMIVNTSFLVREIRRNEQHDSFINAVTHELKTPVASIRLHLETLQRREMSDVQRQEFYRLMLSDTDRLTETVEQVLRAGRAGDRRAGREKTEVDFAQVVRDCMDAARMRHHLQTEALHYESAETNGAGVRVLGSAEDLRTAVFNVLDNAIKYSGEKVDVHVRLETPDAKRVVLTVQDQGIGIHADDLKQVFKRFYRVPHRALSNVKGTGLGLFIVQAIARKHGGRVFAKSGGEGHGTTITLELPRPTSL
jgi:signal transduction histidine kinase